MSLFLVIRRPRTRTSTPPLSNLPFYFNTNILYLLLNDDISNILLKKFSGTLYLFILFSSFFLQYTYIPSTSSPLFRLISSTTSLKRSAASPSQKPLSTVSTVWRGYIFFRSPGQISCSGKNMIKRGRKKGIFIIFSQLIKCFP